MMERWFFDEGLEHFTARVYILLECGGVQRIGAPSISNCPGKYKAQVG
jgi:hypothetical protein